MTTERNERRAKMLEKVRKLLAMGRDGRGNEHEEAAAMRQANKIMAEFGIAEAECDMSAIDAGEMEFGEAEFGRDGAAPVQGKVYRSAPTWCGVLGVGVARFTDTIIIRKSTGAGKIYAFQGELQDVELARWIFGVLVQSIQTEHRASGWTHRGEGAAFKSSAASALAIRLRTLAPSLPSAVPCSSKPRPRQTRAPWSWSIARPAKLLPASAGSARKHRTMRAIRQLERYRPDAKPAAGSTSLPAGPSATAAARCSIKATATLRGDSAQQAVAFRRQRQLAKQATQEQ